LGTRHGDRGQVQEFAVVSHASGIQAAEGAAERNRPG
jgi:hypothetical protein